MQNIFKILSVSDWIQLVGIIASLIVSIVAVVISIKTLKQNSKMIDESTRPMIVIYNDIVSAHSPIQYLIIRNFGNSAATITDLKLEYYGNPTYSKTLFAHMKGQIIAPGQSYSTAFKFEDSSVVIDAAISYKSTAGKEYKESFQIHQMALTDHSHAKSAPKDQEAAVKVIAEGIQDLLRSRL